MTREEASAEVDALLDISNTLIIITHKQAEEIEELKNEIQAKTKAFHGLCDSVQRHDKATITRDRQSFDEITQLKADNEELKNEVHKAWSAYLKDRNMIGEGEERQP